MDKKDRIDEKNNNNIKEDTDLKNLEITTNPDDCLEEKNGVTTVTLLIRDVYNAAIERAEANAKRWFRFCIALLIALVITNIAWLIYELQYDNVVITQDANTDGGGNASVNGAVGDIIYGKSEADDQIQEAKD